jgi:hypothetical protein
LSAAATAMNSEPPKTKADSDRDARTFEELPAKTKELVVLKDTAEKSTGKERAAVDQTIKEKSK